MVTPLETLQNLLHSIAEEQKYEDCNIIARQISTDGASYSGCLYFAVISAPGKDSLKVFAKVLCTGEMLREFFSHLYRVENFFYTKLVKYYESIENKYEIAIENKFRTAKFYGCNTRIGNEAIVLEDLTVIGYNSFDRHKSVTWEQTVECVGQLAKFHALSIALSKENPKEYEKVKQEFISYDDFFKNVVHNTKPKVIEAVEENDKNRILTFIEQHFNSDNFPSSLLKPITKEFIVHGDYRPSNLMHRLVIILSKHDIARNWNVPEVAIGLSPITSWALVLWLIVGGDTSTHLPTPSGIKGVKNGECQVIALDMQSLRCGSPVFDLIYFINLGTGDELRKNKFQEILDLYYDELCAALQRFKINPNEEFSRENFEYELKSIMPYAVLFTMCILLVVKVDEDSALEHLDNFDVADFGYAPNEIFKKELKGFIEFYSDIGIIP